MNDSLPGERPDFLQFIGTATVLIRYGGITVLTDPNFLHRHDKVHLGYGLTAERLTDPALEIDELPPPDLVVLSHLHEDHFDREVRARLRKDVPIVTTREAARKLRTFGFAGAVGLETYAEYPLERGGTRLTVTALPGRHGPGPLALALPNVMGSLLEFQASSGARKRLYLSGDTLLFDRLQEIPQRFPGIDVGLFHLGGTRIMGVTLTMTGEQGIAAIRLVAPRMAIPIHYDDYSVFKSPLADFKAAVKRQGLSGSVRYLDRGEVLEL